MGDKEILVEDDSVVTIELDGEVSDVNSTLPEEPDDSVVEVKSEGEKKPRIRQTKTELADATEALQQAVTAAESARHAAEATAQSERNRADQATRVAQQREQEARSYQTQAEDRQLAIISNGIEAAKRELDSATQEQQRAYESGEFAQATAAGARMAKAAAALDRFETSKVDYESRPKRQPVHQDDPGQQQPSGNALDQYLSSVGPRAQAWLRLHPECVPSQFGGDRVSNAKAMRGHNDAVARGVAEGSDDYFKILEEHIGYRTAPVSDAAVTSGASAITPAQESDNPVPQPRRQTPQPRAPMPSAPVSRDAPGPSGATASRTVRLTPQQQEIALISFSQKQGETDDTFRKRAFSSYASELVRATSEGKIGRMTH